MNELQVSSVPLVCQPERTPRHYETHSDYSLMKKANESAQEGIDKNGGKELVKTLDLAIGVRVPASQPNRIKHLRAAQISGRPFCVPIVCQTLKSRLLCAGFREQHSLQLVRSTLLHVW